MTSQTRSFIPYSSQCVVACGIICFRILKRTLFPRSEYCDERRLTDRNVSGRLAIITHTVVPDANDTVPLGRWIGVIETTISSPTMTVQGWRDIFEADLAAESSVRPIHLDSLNSMH